MASAPLVIFRQSVPITADGRAVSTHWLYDFEKIARAVTDNTARLDALPAAASPAAPTPNFGGDVGFGGSAGLVPAPIPGDGSKWLKGDGTWSKLPAPTFPTSTASALTGAEELAVRQAGEFAVTTAAAVVALAADDASLTLAQRSFAARSAQTSAVVIPATVSTDILATQIFGA